MTNENVITFCYVVRHGYSSCMKDAPTLKPPAIPSYIKHNLPGTIFDGHKQCQYSLGTPAARQCANVSNDQVVNLATVGICLRLLYVETIHDTSGWKQIILNCLKM